MSSGDILPAHSANQEVHARIGAAPAEAWQEFGRAVTAFAAAGGVIEYPGANSAGEGAPRQLVNAGHFEECAKVRLGESYMPFGAKCYSRLEAIYHDDLRDGRSSLLWFAVHPPVERYWSPGSASGLDVRSLKRYLESVDAQLDNAHSNAAKQRVYESLGRNVGEKTVNFWRQFVKDTLVEEQDS